MWTWSDVSSSPAEGPRKSTLHNWAYYKGGDKGEGQLWGDLWIWTEPVCLWGLTSFYRPQEEAMKSIHPEQDPGEVFSNLLYSLKFNFIALAYRKFDVKIQIDLLERPFSHAGYRETDDSRHGWKVSLVSQFEF